MSNLPPGVTDSMIPGNRPEDADYETFLDDLGSFCIAHGLDWSKLSDDELERFDAIGNDLFVWLQGVRPEVG